METLEGKTVPTEVYRPQQILFVSTTDCTKTDLFPVSFFANNIHLVDLLPDGSPITVADTYSGGAISVFEKWSMASDDKPEAIANLPGHIAPITMGKNKPSFYQGPILKTFPSVNKTLMTFQVKGASDYQMVLRLD